MPDKILIATFRRLLMTLWPVHWLWVFQSVYGRDPRRRDRVGTIRPYGWADLWQHAAHLWRSGEWVRGWGFVNGLYGGEEVF